MGECRTLILDEGRSGQRLDRSGLDEGKSGQRLDRSGHGLDGLDQGGSSSPSPWLGKS